MGRAHLSSGKNLSRIKNKVLGNNFPHIAPMSRLVQLYMKDSKKRKLYYEEIKGILKANIFHQFLYKADLIRYEDCEICFNQIT